MPLPWSRTATRQMAIGVEEFIRAVDAAFPGTVVRGGAALTVSDAKASLRIAYSEGAPQRLGALQLPSLLVQISVLAGDAQSAAALLARLDRATQRGGG